MHVRDSVCVCVSLTLIESSCCRRASWASLLGENMRERRELLGGSRVGTANTPPSPSPPDTRRERGRLRPPEERMKNDRMPQITS